MKKLSKKILLLFFIIFSVATFLPTSSNPAFAAQGLGRACPTYLGLTSWDCNLKEHPQSEDDLKWNIVQIAANVADDITVIAAYLVLGYVIYGGYLYMFYSTDPAKVAAGKKTLAHAFIGFAIAMSARLIMGTIRIVLVGGQFGDCSESECVDPGSLVEGLITWFISMAGIISAIFLVYGGITYVTSSGDSNKLQRAKQTIIYSLIGLAIVALSITITAFVSNMIRGAQTSIIEPTNQIIIAKEIK